MKKNLFMILILALILSVSLTACAEESKSKPKDNVKKVEEKKENPNSKVPVTIDKLPFNIELDSEPDSAGYVFAHVTFKNNSEYPVSNCLLTVGVKGQDAPVFHTCNELVLPNTTSPEFTSWPQKNRNKDDIEYLTLEYQLKDTKSGKKVNIKYDYKLDEYEVDIYEE
ncbi:hypothetical protein ACGCUP_01105 [Eubacteriales bacterium KG125]